MRRKLTEIQNLPADELPSLTEKQMSFVQGILAGKTASDAYRAAYDCANSQAKTVWVEASKLFHHPDVALWLSAARKAALATVLPSLEQCVAEMTRIREVALDSGNIGAAQAAQVAISKMAGHMGDVKVDIALKEPTEALKAIENELGPEVAALIAKQCGASALTEETLH